MDVYRIVLSGNLDNLVYVGSGNFSEVYQATDRNGTAIIVKVTKNVDDRNSFLIQGLNVLKEREQFKLRSKKIAVTDNSIKGTFLVQSTIEDWNNGRYWNKQPEATQHIHYVRTLGTYQTDEVIIEILENVEMLNTHLTMIVGSLMSDIQCDGKVYDQDELLEIVIHKAEQDFNIDLPHSKLRATLDFLSRISQGNEINYFNFINDAFNEYKRKFPILLVDTAAGRLPIADLYPDNTFPMLDEQGNLTFRVFDLVPHEQRISSAPTVENVKNNIK